ncbi:hypothetical protein PXK01_16710 [Phaeobacter sp. PT47_59]|uniref:hypothetical protein n=1 Tax=Phaeobacter sp. PT47_59 TaxID=3029979 RepID=UPI002380A11C|nr:hypothetical protein [Phaeobacter sp. PT47_59]MDE4175806.1 hypothetical protein [Phaeobacter sp. PT47_59]
MPVFDAVAQAQLSERRGTNAKVLLWFQAKNRQTGAPETLGFWSGDDHQEFLIGGEIRTYYGAGNVIDVPPIVARPGFQVRHYRVTVPPFTDEVKILLQQYKPRLAAVQIHSVPLDIDTGLPMGAPKRVFKGYLNQAPEEIGRKGGTSRTELVLVSGARKLTFGLPLKRSNAELQRRNAKDRGREYSDVAGSWTVPWGTG